MSRGKQILRGELGVHLRLVLRVYISTHPSLHQHRTSVTSREAASTTSFAPSTTIVNTCFPSPVFLRRLGLPNQARLRALSIPLTKRYDEGEHFKKVLMCNYRKKKQRTKRTCLRKRQRCYYKCNTIEMRGGKIPTWERLRSVAKPSQSIFAGCTGRGAR